MQVALSANNVGVQHVAVMIPTPDASQKFPDYPRYYSTPFEQPKSLIKFSALVEDCIGCPYNMDEQDDCFLEKHNASCPPAARMDVDLFEQLMWSLERVANEKVM